MRRGLSLGATILGLALIGVIGWLAFYAYTTEKLSRGAEKIVDAGAQVVQTVAETVIKISEHMRPAVIETTFAQWRKMEVQGNQGNILEVATAQSTETFTRISELRVAYLVSLGTTVSEISVPVTYRYHIDLVGDWQVHAEEGGAIAVVAPPLVPSLPVAFDSTGLKKKTQSGWARWNADENLALLETSLSPQLAVRAADKRTLSEVREPARLSIAHFLKRWLLAQDHWREGRYTELHVVFPDELPQGGLDALPLHERVPTLKLGAEPPTVKVAP